MFLPISMIGVLAIMCQPSSRLATFESKYYVLETELPPDRALWIGRVMDAAGKEYDRRFQGFRGKVRQKPRLKVFATQQAYLAELKRTAYGGNHEFTSGVFVPLDGVVYTFDDPELEVVLKHECFHQFVDQVVGGDLPRWTNEGLADYFGFSPFDDKTGQLQLGTAPPATVESLRAAKQAKSMIPISELIGMSAEGWWKNMADGPKRQLQYAQSWALCHFLVHGDGGKYRELFGQYLAKIDQGLDGDSAFKTVFGADMQPLQAKYDAYIDELAAAATRKTGK